MCADVDESDAPLTEPLASVADLLDIAGQLTTSTVVVVGGDRVEDLRLVESARDHGIVDRIILVGDRDRITRAVDEVEIPIDPGDIVATDDEEGTAVATVELIEAGQVDIVLKGNISTPIINRHMLPLAVRPTVSLATVFDAAAIADGRPMVMTDAGVTTVCNLGRLADLIRNAVDVARTVMRIDRPRVAVLSANEKQIPSLPSTGIGLDLARRDWPDAIVCGPLSLDLATDPESVTIKGMPHVPNAEEVAGRADVLVCPGIDTANVLYKTISAMNKYGDASLASITVGFPVPYIILSRSDGLETRLVSIALCAVYAHRTGRGRPPQPRAAAGDVTETYRVLAVNPGSTSVKLAVYENDRCVHASEVAREADVERLTALARGVLDECGGEIHAVAAAGGLLPRPADAEKLAAGIYAVDDGMVSAMDRAEAEHPSNFAPAVAAALAKELDVPAFVVDPVVVDEFAPEAQLSGYAPVVRRSTSHALSVRAAARKAAEAVGRPIEGLNLVVAHLGGGITVAAVRGGKMVDNNIALLGEGPFTPRRAGQLPAGELIDLCYSGRFTRDELVEELTQRGGLTSYLGTDDVEEIERRIDAGDDLAAAAVDAMVYQIAKEIGRALVAAGCDVEAIVLTGGLVQSKRITTAVRRRVSRLAPVMVFKDPLEMAALADAAIDVLAGRVQAQRYTPPQ